jgi:hypothetical protein
MPFTGFLQKKWRKTTFIFAQSVDGPQSLGRMRWGMGLGHECLYKAKWHYYEMGEVENVELFIFLHAI